MSPNFEIRTAPSKVYCHGLKNIFPGHVIGIENNHHLTFDDSDLRDTSTIRIWGGLRSALYVQMRTTLSFTVTTVVGSDERELTNGAILSVGHPKGFRIDKR